MKKLFFKVWFRLFPKRAVNQMNTKLQRAILENKMKQINLIKEVRDYIVEDLKIDSSKFIPLSVRKQACSKVMKAFGERLKTNNLKINTNLQLIKL